MPWDHPRVGGEKLIKKRHSAQRQGSPPRGRGKVDRQPEAGHKTGITPAWAGKSEVSKYAAKPGEDHPRVGGEKCGMMQQPTLWLGSPPRGRGKAF